MSLVGSKSSRTQPFILTLRRTHYSSLFRPSLVSRQRITSSSIIEKSTLKDFEFFLGQSNFLKVVDTLNKFEDGILDKNSPKARDFVLFKRQLYAMYEVQNRSVGEHELFSFNIERKNLLWLYNANLEFVNELKQQDLADQLGDHSRLGPNQVYRMRTLNPRRFKGLGAFISAYGMYSYAPYIAVYLGATAPLLGAVAAGLYGMLSFSESQFVKSITLIRDGSENHGKLLLEVGLSALTSTEFIVDVKDIHSIISLGDDDLGVEGKDGNVLRLKRYFDKASNQWVESERALSLPGDAFRDRTFMDWILADKNDEGKLADEFQDLMIRQHESSTLSGKIGTFDLLAARDNVTVISDTNQAVEAKI